MASPSLAVVMPENYISFPPWLLPENPAVPATSPTMMVWADYLSAKAMVPNLTPSPASVPNLAPSLSPATVSESKGLPLVSIIVGVGIIVLVTIAIFLFRRWKRKKKKKKKEEMLDDNNERSSGGQPTSPSPHSHRSLFTYEELAKATDGFSDDNLLGQGGFGYVHKGVLRDGKVVAVKHLKAGSGQGEREFQAEVDVIGRVHHRHLVSLLGYCISGPQRMLVYEFVPNGNLEFHLHGKGNPTMTWSTRMKIAIGSAKGMAYLHEDCKPKIIHRDIKAANILVDDDFVAEVADFGLAKFSLDTDTHVSTRVMGTFGYLAPEYASSGKLTEKSDVFSFGVVLLELITGRYPIDERYTFLNDSMVEWARPLLRQALENGNFEDIVDSKLQNDYDSDEMKRMVACAAACVRHSARLRPRMSQIVRALEGNMPLDELSEGVRPGHSMAYGSSGSQEYGITDYKQDLEKFRKLALESQ